VEAEQKVCREKTILGIEDFRRPPAEVPPGALLFRTRLAGRAIPERKESANAFSSSPSPAPGEPTRTNQQIVNASELSMSRLLEVVERVS